jgi:hypothetical protein
MFIYSIVRVIELVEVKNWPVPPIELVEVKNWPVPTEKCH